MSGTGDERTIRGGGHDAGHDAILQELLTGGGGVDGNRQELLASLAGCELCEEKLAEMEVVGGLLSIEEVATDRMPPFDAGEAAGVDRLRALAARDFPDAGRERGADADPAARSSPRRRLVVGGLAAAAACLLVVLTLMWDGLGEAPSPPPGGDLFIGEDRLTWVTPEGPELAAGDLVLSWTGSLDEGERYRVTVRDDAGSPLLEFTTTESSWAPPVDAQDRWRGRSLRIHVSVVDRFDEPSRVSDVLRVDLSR